MKKRRALVLGPGVLHGAYGAGVAAELCRRLGSQYFDSIFGCSVGAFAAAFFVADQPYTIKRTWKQHLHGKLLVDLGNVVSGRPIVKLGYLTSIFQNLVSMLNTGAITQEFVQLVHVLTNAETGEPMYVRPRGKDVLVTMSASAAMPFFHPPVSYHGTMYIDGSLSDPFPIAEALKAHDFVVAVYNRPIGQHINFCRILRSLSWLMPDPLKHLMQTYPAKVLEAEKILTGDSRVITLHPSRVPLRSFVDSDRERLIETVDLGIMDAQAALPRILKLG